MALAATPVADSVLRALGRLVINFGMLESLVVITAGSFISSDQGANRIALQQQPLDRKLTILDSLGSHRLHDRPQILESLKSITREIRTLNVKRNELLHEIGLAPENPAVESITKLRFQIDVNKGLVVRPIDFTAPQIDGIADAAAKRVGDLVRFMIENKDAPGFYPVPLKDPS